MKNEQAPEITLYDWSPSPFCIKVRAILRHKGLAYRRLPALQHRREIARLGGTGKVPLLLMAGEAFADSTEIAHALERRFPSPPIVPRALRDHALCHALEDWADESLYFFGLYYHWHEPAGRARVSSYFGKTLLGWLAFRPYLAKIERQLHGQGMSRKSPEQIYVELHRTLASIEGMLTDRSYLLGDGPFLCDFALMGQLVYLQRAPVTSNLLERWPATQHFLHRMKARYVSEKDTGMSAPHRAPKGEPRGSSV